MGLETLINTPLKTKDEENSSKRNVFKVFHWKVIDKTNKTSHPLWFRSYEDLAAFYRAHHSLCVNSDDLRIIKMDENGSQVEKFAFEI